MNKLQWFGFLGVILLGAPSGFAQSATDATAEIPAARQSLLKTTKNKRFDMPMSFDPNESGVVLPRPEIDYDATLDEGHTLRIGATLVNAGSFSFTLGSLAHLNAEVARLPGVDGQKVVLALRWPEVLMKGGHLEMISRAGTVLWETTITPDEVEGWQKRRAMWRQALQKRGVPESQLKTGLFATQMLLENLPASHTAFWRRFEVFRFCFTQTEGAGQSRLCSSRYVIQGEKQNVRLQKVPSAVAPRVVVMNRAAPLSGVVAVPPDQKGQFYADLAGGESYEFQSFPPSLDLMDMSDTVRPGLLRVSGFGVRPLDRHILLNPDRYSAWVVMLGFEPTIGDRRKFWAAPVPLRDAKLFFPGEGGGVFRQRFELSEIPRAAARPHLDSQTTKGTYIDGVVLRGRKLPDSAVTSDEYAIKTNSSDPTLFYWKFRATEPGQLNKSYLSVNYQGKTYRSFFEVHRAYANELSARLSGFVASGRPLFVGEVSYNHWFENWFGWDQYWVTTQRWGVSARYFKTMTQLPVGGVEKADLSVTTADLKYRLTPGLWTRDETLVLMLAYQDVNFGALKAPMTGVGLMWARSMPRSIDDMFNLLPFMDYPKWVDVEFIYFVNSMDKNIRLNRSMALNFHGQVLWKKNYFGEAGFGYKRYGFQNILLSKEARLDTFYATVGVGVKF
ncbi:MAG: hypothetical protein KF865_05270 [Bdellovibrionaceae bacterium]|nr:hypothetical protein [Pseudobdellovibrionaceae bacterium]